MFLKLVRKEIAHRALDSRFAIVLIVCVLLTTLGTLVGTKTYLHERREHAEASESRRLDFEDVVERRDFRAFMSSGYSWNRPPEVLATVVQGLSGVLGREVNVRYHSEVKFQPIPLFERSPLEANPAYAIFGRLDLSFIILVVLGLAAFLLSFDSVSGEKEQGTFRLYASYPVPRATIALAKLCGVAVTILAPLVLAALVTASLLALNPEIELTTGEWWRLAGILCVFSLYLVVFAAFGVWVSAWCRRSSVAVIVLLSLWALWIFVLPSGAVRLARTFSPITDFYEIERRSNSLRWEIARQTQEERVALWRQRYDWDSLEPEERNAVWRDRRFVEDPEIRDIETRWLAEYRRRMRARVERRANEFRTQERMIALLSSLSPAGSASMMAMDLSGTGPGQQREVEDALTRFHEYLISYTWEKEAHFMGGAVEEPTLSDFTPFRYETADTFAETARRNLLQLANLIALAALGTAGAFTAVLRYDVR